MQRTMQNHAAVFRTGPLLEEGVRKINEINAQMKVPLSDDASCASAYSCVYLFVCLIERAGHQSLGPFSQLQHRPDRTLLPYHTARCSSCISCS
jgi:hypothetical protein